MPRGKARQYASDVDEWGTGALWGARLGGGKRGNVLPVHLKCWVPRFPSWSELNKDLRVTWIHKRVQKKWFAFDF